LSFSPAPSRLCDLRPSCQPACRTSSFTRTNGTLAGHAEHDGGIPGASRARRVRAASEWAPAWVSRPRRGDLRGTAKLAARAMASTPLRRLGSLPGCAAYWRLTASKACLSLNSRSRGVVLSHRAKEGETPGRSQVPTLSIWLLCVMYMERSENMHVRLGLLLQISNPRP
jgi:hypothetical protein